ncbi:MAG TPA: hypothetical protein VLY23_11625 [Candidatus Acidoferrum sp.]|nr:hypothetical protein [Candidatus Acidoferrum sp.]
MPFRFELDRKNQILACRFEGRVTDRLLTQFLRDVVPKVIAAITIRGTVTDFSKVTAFDATADTIRGLAWGPPADPDVTHLRVIVAPTAKMFGLARLFAAHGEDTRPNLHVVQKLDDAYALLGVINPQFEPITQPD